MSDETIRSSNVAARIENGVGEETESGSGLHQIIDKEPSEEEEDEGLLLTNSNTSSLSSSYLQHKCGDLEVVALIGLCVASIAGGLVADMFGLFHVDVFLRAYQLPLKVYGIGNIVFAFINTANDVAGAWCVDWYSSQVGQERHQLVGLTGCLFALSFLTPFFRWGPGQGTKFWDGFHFVGTKSVYDTVFSFNCILGSSIVTDNHNMEDTDRIIFFASRRIVSMVAPVVVSKVGLSLFDINNLRPFRIFVVVIAVVASILSIGAQKLINLYKDDDDNKKKTTNNRSRNNKRPEYSKLDGTERSDEFTIDEEDDQEDSVSAGESSTTTTRLNFWQVVKDFVAHPNFRWWILMEMLMEGQNTFLGDFEKTMVDRLLYIDETQGLSRETCDWMLSLMSPMTQLMGFVLYVPIQRFGYARLYKVVFACNFILSCLLLLLNGISNQNDGETNNTVTIMVIMALISIMSNAMASTGFGLAMSDMVLEMKYATAVTQGRLDAPSLAGMFMGVNALFCKPMESILPVLTASLLSNTDYDETTNSPSTRLVLFRLLVFPPLICSFLQFFIWSNYSLVPERTQQMREELQSLRDKQQKQQQHQDGKSSIEMNSLALKEGSNGGCCASSKSRELV